jgi:EAL domain-containing protein (putative c-di-GMP-specific phosphodiesterase class I)
MVRDLDQAKIVHSVLALAKSLGMPTIAEGVEHVQTMRELTRSGAEYGQGFYFGRAMPAGEADELVRGTAVGQAVRQRA